MRRRTFMKWGALSALPGMSPHAVTAADEQRTRGRELDGPTGSPLQIVGFGDPAAKILAPYRSAPGASWCEEWDRRGARKTRLVLHGHPTTRPLAILVLALGGHHSPWAALGQAHVLSRCGHEIWLLCSLPFGFESTYLERAREQWLELAGLSRTVEVIPLDSMQVRQEEWLAEILERANAYLAQSLADMVNRAPLRLGGFAAPWPCLDAEPDSQGA